MSIESNISMAFFSDCNTFATPEDSTCAIVDPSTKDRAVVPPVFYFRDSTLTQIESVGVAKVLQSEKNATEILDAMDIFTPEKR